MLFRDLPNLIVLIVMSILLISSSGMPAKAVVVGPWSLTGPGSTSVDISDNSTILSYALNAADFTPQTWTATANVIETGLYQFDWEYNGLHAVFGVEVFLDTTNPNLTLVDVGPADCCASPSGGFSFNGSDAFLVTAGETIGFTFGGTNTDIDNYLLGSLEVSAVPLPSTFVMLLIALSLTGFIAHRGGRLRY